MRQLPDNLRVCVRKVVGSSRTWSTWLNWVCKGKRLALPGSALTTPQMCEHGDVVPHSQTEQGYRYTCGTHFTLQKSQRHTPKRGEPCAGVLGARTQRACQLTPGTRTIEPLF